MPQQSSRLPYIDQFLEGLVTNRNMVSSVSSFLVTGQQRVHHDVLSDGQNVEVSAYNTIVRRPGFTLFNSLTSPAVDMFQYKDLTGAISLWQDTGTSLKQGASTVITNSVGTTFPWSLVGRGNFLYATNGFDYIRMKSTSLTNHLPMSQPTPGIRLQITQQSLAVYNAVTGFIAGSVGGSQDAIGGLLTITDAANQRTLTITINASTIHYNVTYTGNLISANQSYTTNTAQTGTGTGLNITTQDVVTQVSGYSTTVTGTGVTNGVANYFPSTGISTVDFDIAYSSTMTLDKLAAANLVAITAAAGFSYGSQIPSTASAPLRVFAGLTVVQGIYAFPGAPPVNTQLGVALNITVTPNTAITTVQISSGLYDITNPQLSLQTNIGIAPRLYQYVSPAVNVTDTFTGSLTIQLVDYATNPVTTYNFVNQTLAQIQTAISATAHCQAVYVQTGTTCYIFLRNFQSSATSPGTTDVTLVMVGNSLVDNQDPNLNFQNWNNLSSNDYVQLPQQSVQISYASRDIYSGGLSNLAPPVTIGPQIFPTRWSAALNLPGPLYNPAFPAVENGNQNIELYRTVDGGSSFLFEQLIGYQNLEQYFTNFSIPDSGLNEELIGPINEENDPPPIGLIQITSHTGRLWGFVGNRVYYGGGPDTINGNGDEAWPPGNYFDFPGLITDIKSLDKALIVALTDDLHVITGVDSSSYYAKPWLIGFGISNRNAWVGDGQGIFVYTSKSQLHAIFDGEDAGEIGFAIGDKLMTFFPPATTSLTFHRSSALDTALYVSNGSNTIYRYEPARKRWSPRAQPVSPMTAGRVKSLETGTGIQTLLNSTPLGVFARNLTTFADNGLAYPAFVTVGVMNLAPLGTKVTLNNIAAYFTATGTLPQIWVLLNEINSTLVPFTQLMNPVNDPPDAPPSQSVWAKRWFTQSTLTTFPTGTGLVNLASIKIVFSPTDTVQNELRTLALRDSI